MQDTQQTTNQQLDILVYSKDYCPYCKRAKELLTREGFTYQEIDIGLHPEKRAEMIAASNGRTTVPQIFINQKHVGGCDDLFDLYRQHHKIIEPLD